MFAQASDIRTKVSLDLRIRRAYSSAQNQLHVGCGWSGQRVGGRSFPRHSRSPMSRHRLVERGLSRTMARVNAALIGSGNIGTDLMFKALRSSEIRPVWMVGIDAAEHGLKTTAEGVDGLLPYLQQDQVQIAFDATSAYVHRENARKLQARGVVVIDLTPATIGPYCVPPVNLS